MPPVVINLAGATGFTVVPAGKYEATISKLPEIVPSKSTKGNWNINFEFQLKDPSQKHWETRSLAPTVLWRFKEELTNMGIDPPGELDLDDFKEWLRETFPVGYELILDMTEEEDTYRPGKNPDGSPKMQNRATMLSVDSSESGW